jgi:DNA repair protein RecN (Recombination protein N)
MCAVGTLSRLGEYLVDIHGQHEHQRLMRPSSHMEYLDDYGSPEHMALLDGYRSLWERWRAAVEELQRASLDEAERLREMDLLRFQVREIEAASPGEGEIEELLKERRRMQNREELFNAARDAYRLLKGEDEGALDLLGEAETLLARASSLEDDFAGWSEKLRETQGIMSEIAHEIRAYTEGLDFEPGRLEEVESRLRTLGDLTRKYGRSTQEILGHLEKARSRLEELESLDLTREKLEKEVSSLERELAAAADKLTASRSALAERLARETNRQLREMNMAGMRFQVALGGAEAFTERGRDTVEFMVSPGKSLPFRPIARIASGGELSRIMLAIKLCLAKADCVPTLVFDEVDAGIGGSTADVLAEKLAGISRYHQVFSITHLPQVAAVADRHMSVAKRETARGIKTNVELLEGESRLQELARMLGGDESTAREHAQSLLRREWSSQPARSRAGSARKA